MSCSKLKTSCDLEMLLGTFSMLTRDKVLRKCSLRTMTTCLIAMLPEHVLNKALENLSIGWFTDLVDIFKQLRFYNCTPVHASCSWLLAPSCYCYNNSKHIYCSIMKSIVFWLLSTFKLCREISYIKSPSVLLPPIFLLPSHHLPI
jgi:hypothetical protein